MGIISTYGDYPKEEKEKKEWVGNSLKTIVLTVAEYIACCYCSQCGHMAEG